MTPRAAIVVAYLTAACANGGTPERGGVADASADDAGQQSAGDASEFAQGEDAGQEADLPGWRITHLGFGHPATFDIVGDELYWLESADHVPFELRKATLPDGNEHRSVALPEGTAYLEATASRAYVATAAGAISSWDGTSDELEPVWQAGGTLLGLLADGDSCFFSTDALYRLGLPPTNPPVRVPRTLTWGALGTDGSLYGIDVAGFLARYDDGELVQLVEVPTDKPTGPGQLRGLAQRGDDIYFMAEDALFHYATAANEIERITDTTGYGPLWLSGEYAYWLDVLEEKAVLRTHLTDVQVEVVLSASKLGRSASPWKSGVILTIDDEFVWLHE